MTRVPTSSRPAFPANGAVLLRGLRCVVSFCARSALLLTLVAGSIAAPGAHAQQATPSPTPGASSAAQLTVNAPVVNVRNGPGLAYRVLGTASRGQQYAITGRDAGVVQWWQIDFKGGPGWIYAALVSTGADTASVKLVASIPPPPAKASAAGTPAPSPAGTPLGTPAATRASPEAPVLPPYQESVTLNAGTSYPVRAGTVKGWSYELVDRSQDYDLLVNRDVFGTFLNRLWPDLLQRHPGGIRITFGDATPGVNYQGSARGFGDGVSAWVADEGCATQHEDHGAIWTNTVVECSVTLVAPGPGLTNLALAAAVLGYGRVKDTSFGPAFDREPFTLLGSAVRDAATGQWQWSDSFLQVVALKPAAAPSPSTAAGAPATPKTPPPPATGHIVFTRGRNVPSSSPAGECEIASVDVKTGAVQLVATHGRQPDVRRDGRIVFNGEGAGRDDLQVVALDGTGLSPIGRHPEDSAPRWSADGSQLAFHSRLAGGDAERLFIQSNSGVREEPMHLQYETSPLYGRFPFWTLDGLGYSGCVGGDCGIWVTGLRWAPTISQTFRRRLTDQPDDRATGIRGDTLIFASFRTGNWDLYTIPAAGGKAQNVTQNPSQDMGGAFSPDGNYIAFMSDRAGWGIWVMEADGSNPRQVIAVPDGFGKLWDQDHLAWGP